MCGNPANVLPQQIHKYTPSCLSTKDIIQRQRQKKAFSFTIYIKLKWLSHIVWIFLDSIFLRAFFYFSSFFSFPRTFFFHFWKWEHWSHAFVIRFIYPAKATSSSLHLFFCRKINEASNQKGRSAREEEGTSDEEKERKITRAPAHQCCQPNEMLIKSSSKSIDSLLNFRNLLRRWRCWGSGCGCWRWQRRQQHCLCLCERVCLCVCPACSVSICSSLKQSTISWIKARRFLRNADIGWKLCFNFHIGFWRTLFKVFFGVKKKVRAIMQTDEEGSTWVSEIGKEIFYID